MKTMRNGEGSGMVPFLFAGRTFYGHTGGADNYGAWLAYMPEEKLAVAYASNAKNLPVAPVVRDVCHKSTPEGLNMRRIARLRQAADPRDPLGGSLTPKKPCIRLRDEMLHMSSPLFAKPTLYTQFIIDNKSGC